MVNLNLVHYVYLIVIVIILITICFKKDIVLPSIIGIGIVGYIYTGNIINAIQIIYKAVVVSSMEFIEIIIIISLINAMSKVLKDIQADELMVSPLKKLMTNGVVSFFVLGISMLIISWLIWPSPAIAFVGAILVPVAVKSGLPPIWAAVALNIFGNGAALSGDYFIQGAPAITAKAAGIDNIFNFIKTSVMFWGVMAGVVIGTSFLFMKKELLNIDNSNKRNAIEVSTNIKVDAKTKFLAVITPVMFLLDIIFIYLYGLKGGEAASLIGGTSIIIMILGIILKFGFKEALGKTTEYIKDGFIFGIKMFAPIIIIGAFFFMGSKESAAKIFGHETSGLLTDIGMYVSGKVPLNKVSIIVMQILISVLLGIGGSGFSGLPLIGTLSQVFSSSITISKEGLAAIGQIVTIWIGGGTIIPWSVISAAAICDVQPMELVRKNIIPVVLGIVAVGVFGMFVL